MCYWKVERECLKTYQCVHIIVRRPDRKISPWTTVSLAQHSIGQADGECVLLAILLRCYTVCCRRSIIVTIATAFYGETQMQNRSARHHSYRQPHQFTSVTIFTRTILYNDDQICLQHYSFMAVFQCSHKVVQKVTHCRLTGASTHMTRQYILTKYFTR